MEVLGQIPCGGESHRLLVVDKGLRLLDHEDEKAQVFDALTGGSACHEAAAAWTRLVHRYDDGEHDGKPYFAFVDALMPDHDDEDWYVTHREDTMNKADQLDSAIAGLRAAGTDADLVALAEVAAASRDSKPLLELPEKLRNALALIWVGHAVDIGAVRDPARARRLRRAVAGCWVSLSGDGVPSAQARRRLVWDVRAHRWGAPPRQDS